VNLPGLRDFLGSDFRTEPLKPIGLRLRNGLKPWLIRQPQRAMSHLVTTAEGRHHKLLVFGRSIRNRHALIEERLRALAEHPSVPALLWRDESHLLVEWVEGTTPRADDSHFARRLGEALAELYRVGFALRDRSDVVADACSDAAELAASGHLPETVGPRLEERLETSLPESVPTSMLCGDQNLANFILDADGSLHMIDPGSFQWHLPIDIFLMGGSLYQQIDHDAFHEAYAHAGGVAFPFLHAEPLSLIQLVRHCAIQCRVRDRTPLVEPRRRRNLQRSIDEELDRIRSQLAL
jgi:hypothetical protein